jgi:uncharacterized membrane protein YeaQ/YmgE (transglycosylase-associated protein family)
MMLILVWLVIGIGVGAAVTSFRSGAGNELSFPLGIIAGIVGSVIGAYAFAVVGRMAVGEGPVSSLLCWVPRLLRLSPS